MLKKIISFAAILASFLSIYDFASGRVNDYLSPQRQLQTIISEKNHFYQKDSYVRVNTRGGDLRLYLDISPGVHRSKIFNYPLGAYRLTSSYHFTKVLQNLGASLISFKTQYARDLYVNAELKGYADGHPVKQGAIYPGDLGTISEFAFQNGGAYQLQAGDKLTNKSIAFLRAYDVYNYLEKIHVITEQSNVKLSTNMTDMKGGEFRKIELILVVTGALEPKKITLPTRLLLDTYGFTSEFYIRTAYPQVKNTIENLELPNL